MQKRLFITLLVLTLTMMVVMNILDAPLVTAEAPSGIVSFELAGSLDAAHKMIRSWTDRGRIYAGLSLGFDYLFLLAYACCIASGCGLVASALRERWRILAVLGTGLAWLQFLAALLDGIENYALIRLLLGANANIWPILAWWCAVPKFFIVGLGLLYYMTGGNLYLGWKVFRKKTNL